MPSRTPRRPTPRIPERPLEADKALKEMVHRYFASALGLLIVLAAVLALRNRRDPAQPVRLPAALVLLVVFQGLLGMWTVTLLLKPLIVSAHLVGGLTTMSLLWWLSFDVRPGDAPGGRARAAHLGHRRPRRAGAADHARRLGQHELLGHRLPGLPDLPGLVLARHGFQGRVRAVARPRHRLRGRRARPPGARGHPFHAPHRGGRRGARARLPVVARDRARASHARCGPPGRSSARCSSRNWSSAP